MGIWIRGYGYYNSMHVPFYFYPMDIIFYIYISTGNFYPIPVLLMCIYPPGAGKWYPLSFLECRVYLNHMRRVLLFDCD
jgi:hypothetical protein